MGRIIPPLVDASVAQHHARSHDHSAAGDGTALAPVTITLGGDTRLRRAAAANLRLDAGGAPAGVTELSVEGDAWQIARLGLSLAGDSAERVVIDTAIPGIAIGPGNAARDAALYRSGAGVLRTDTDLAVGAGGFGSVYLSAAGGVVITEKAAPAGIADAARLFCVDDGTGRTVLKVIFGTGPAVRIAWQNDADVIPSGVILLWSGTAATIPAGWALCDGLNGTQDLRDRFIVGGDGTDEAVGGTVSPTAALATHATHPTHVSQGSHAHNPHPNPSHSVVGTLDHFTSNTAASGVGYASHAIPDHAADGAHAHDAHGAHGAHALMKFWRLAYIMKL